MASVKANKPVTISSDLYNELVGVLGGLNVEGADRLLSQEALGKLVAVITIGDDCIDPDGSGMCETHNYRPMAYYVDIKGKVLKRGTFDPEDTGFPVCEDAQKYDERLERQYNRG